MAFTATDQAVELIVDLTHPDYSLSKTRKTELALSLAAVPVQYADPCNLLASALVRWKYVFVSNQTNNALMIVIVDFPVLLVGISMTIMTTGAECVGDPCT